MASCTSFLAAPLVSRRAVARGAARSTVCAAAAKPDRPLYYPGAKAPAYLDGSLSACTETAARAALGVARALAHIRFSCSSCARRPAPRCTGAQLLVGNAA